MGYTASIRRHLSSIPTAATNFENGRNKNVSIKLIAEMQK
jgi:hypothetical protein